MPVIHSNLLFAGSRIRQLQAAVDGDEPLRKAEAVATVGPPGKSAYQIALEEGFVGDEATWLASLQGPPGLDGDDGTDGTDGTDGNDGLPGKSAYQVALDNGFVGTEAAWLASLQGPQGISFYQRRVQTITTVPVLGAITCDWNSYDEIRITLDANVTLTFSGGADGQGCTLKLKQDATGGRTVTMASAVRFNADITAYTPTATASRGDRLGFIHDAGDGKYDFVSVVKGFA